MATFRYPYSPGSPPAPAVALNVAHPTTTAEVRDLPALVDTGADVTVLPLRIVTALGVPQLDTVPVTGYDGNRVDLASFMVRLQVRDLPPEDVEVVAVDAIANAVLGRDVLNRYLLTLNGPGGMLEISDLPPPSTEPAVRRLDL